LVPRIARQTFGPGELRALARGLVQDGLDGRYHDYSGAEQATMAIASVMNHLGQVAGLPDVPGARAAMDRLHAVLRDDERYEPARFREALAALRKTLGN